MRNLVLTTCALLALAGCKQTLAPEAVASGPVDPVPVGSLVVLDGSGSSDPQGRALEYRWKLATRPGGSRAEIADPALAAAWLRPDVEGDYQARLVVSNGALTSEASVAFTVRCGGAAPVVTVAATPEESASGEPVQLEGSFTDADLEPPCSQPQLHTLAWSLVAAPAGSASRLSSTAGPRPFLVPDLPGLYRVRLAVTDSTGEMGEAFAEVDASECGAHAPVIESLSSDPANVGASVQLRSLALDLDTAPPCNRADPLAFAWRFLAKPPASAARFNDPSLAAPSFLPDVAGTYGVELVVTDSTGRSARGQLSLEVSGCGASAPRVASVTASPAAPNAGQAVGLAATVEDADNTAPCSASQLYRLRWTLVGQPAGSLAALSNPEALQPWFLADVPGEYRFAVVATDEGGRTSALESFAVTAGSCGSAVPVATIDAPASAAIGGLVPASAQISDADTEPPCSKSESFAHRWSFAALPAGSQARLNGPELAAPSFVPDVAGDYVLRLIVVDAAGHRSLPAFAAVSVSSCGGAAPVAFASAAPAAPGLGQPVLLSATATDADNDAPCSAGQLFTWRWAFESLPAGSRAALNLATARQPSFVPDLSGEYALRLVATDSTGRQSTPARVTVTASLCGSAAPIATASASPAAPALGQPVLLGATVADADNDAACAAGQSFGFEWSFESLPAGSRATLNAPAARTPSFVPDLAGDYVVRLVATDSTGTRSAPARVTVGASGCGGNAPTVTVATAPAAVGVGGAIQLVPTVMDADNDPACALSAPQYFGYAWTLLSTPAGSRAALSDPSARAPSFVADAAGEFVARLVVTDSAGVASAPAEATISVGACGANPPVVLSAAALPASASAGETVELAAAFEDADAAPDCQALLGAAQTHRVSWRLVSAPPASRAAIGGSDRLLASFVPDAAGPYQFEFTVTDSTGRAASAPALLAVDTCGTAAPTIAPLVDPTSSLHVNGRVALRANGEDADNAPGCAAGQTLEYRWWLAALPAGSRAWIQNPTSSVASFVPDVGGEYTVAVVATDPTGLRSEIRTLVVIVDSCGGNPPVALLSATLEGSVTFGPSADLTEIVIPACVRVLLDGSPSFDPDASCGLPQTSESLGYRWRLVSAPAGATDPLLGSAEATKTFDPSVPSTADDPYVVELRVSDGLLESAPARVKLVTDSFEIDSVEPAMACAGSLPAQITLTGRGFLRVNGLLPEVRFQPGGVAAVADLSGCTPVHPGIEVCTTLVVDRPAGVVNVGPYLVTVTNPVGEACSATAVFAIGPPPSIFSVTPTWACEGPASFGVDGFGFVPGTDFLLGATPADAVTWTSFFHLDADFAALPPGTYDATVSNGGGCASTLANAVTILQNPSIYFVDPEVIYSGISVQATIYVSGINGANVSSVAIRPSGSSAEPAPLAFTYDPAHPNQVQAVFPAGLANGSWEVLLSDAATCSTLLSDAFTVTDQQTVALLAIDPPFGWSGAPTPVTLLAQDPPPAGRTAFQNVPRVYLSPSAGTGLAAGAQAVAFLNPSELTAVVPTLGAGLYDVVVVNPDGSVGVLADGFRVGTLPAPVIDAVSPGSIPSATGQKLVLRGAGFAVGVSVSLFCMDTVGVVTTFATTPLSQLPTQVEVEPPSLPAGSTCVVRATNPDQAYGEFSAIGVTNSSSNIGNFVASSSMSAARRAPSAAHGRPTRTARFLYAIGGDAGAAASAMPSVETVQLDRFGLAGAWRDLPTSLPAARTLAAAQQLGRFVYLAGGNDGTAPLASVIRAEVLEPAGAPVITDLLLEPQATGLDPGLWYYRVSAVMNAIDASNPGGETLPSDPQPVRIPALGDGKLQASISWSQVTGAARYRVYRSPTPNLAAGNERLVAEVGGLQRTFRDDGVATGAAEPRRIGDLGEWHPVASMNLAREGLGLGLGQDPVMPDWWYLYALGGKSAAGVALATYEYLPIRLNADGTQWTATWNLAASPLPNGRWELAAFSVDDLASTRSLPGETYIYAGPGRDAGGMVATADGAKVLTGGLLDVWYPVGGPAYSGYGFAAAANQLFIFGGQNGSPSSATSSAQLCGIGYPCAGGPPDPPDLKNWNSIGISMTARHLMGSTVESAHIFLIGGDTGAGPTNTVESTVW